MKSFITAIFIGTAMIFGCIAYMLQTEKLTAQLTDINSRMILYIEDDDYENAANTHKALCTVLNRNRLVLSAAENHSELDSIQIQLSQISEYITAHRKSDALAYCKVLSITLEHIPKKYRIKAENIF